MARWRDGWRDVKEIKRGRGAVVGGGGEEGCVYVGGFEEEPSSIHSMYILHTCLHVHCTTQL